MRQRVEISGLLAPLFSRVIGKGMVTDMPDSMRNLIAAAEAAESAAAQTAAA